MKIIFHIGLPKTGTTTLQYRVFGPALGEKMIHRSIESEFRICSSLESYLHTGEGSLHDIIAEAKRAVDQHKVVVVSDEVLCMKPREFWLGGGIPPDVLASCLGEIAQALRDTCEVKAVMGIRRQDLWLASWYAYCGRWHPSFSQSDFVRRLSDGELRPRPGISLAWLDFNKSLGLLGQALGVENVMPLPIEALERRRNKFGNRLSYFIGSDVSRELRKVKKGKDAAKLNRTATSDYEWSIKGEEKKTISLDHEMSSAILRSVATSNADLDRTYGIDYRKRTSSWSRLTSMFSGQA